MKSAKYIGPHHVPALTHCRALIRPDPRSRRHVLAQFDKVWTGAGKTYTDTEICWPCFGWHRFKRSDFKMPRSKSHAHHRRDYNQHVWVRGFK